MKKSWLISLIMLLILLNFCTFLVQATLVTDFKILDEKNQQVNPETSGEYKGLYILKTDTNYKCPCNFHYEQENPPYTNYKIGIFASVGGGLDLTSEEFALDKSLSGSLTMGARFSDQLTGRSWLTCEIMRYDGWFLGWRVKKAISFPIIVIKKDLIEARADPGAEAIKEALIDFFQKAKAKKESLTNQDQKNQVDLVVLKLKDAIRNPLKSKYNLDIDQIAKDNYQ